uniref:Uncharacterized protein n=1 Tax=Kalanchoe fedtschenkoi TaxID=63787 RepID=A0A7N0VA22_KALFE
MGTKLHSKVSLIPLTFLCLLSLILLASFHSSAFIVNLKISSRSQHLSAKITHSIRTRKMLASGQFDFTPFLHHLRHPPANRQDRHDLGGDFDPVNAMEKRLVPSGPNPLHH